MCACVLTGKERKHALKVQDRMVLQDVLSAVLLLQLPLHHTGACG